MTGDRDAFLDDDRTSWPVLLDMLSRSLAGPRVLPVEGDSARASLLQLHVAASTPLGAVALHSGGILLHDGWLRIFGGSACHEVGLPSIGQVNDFPAFVDPAWTPMEGVILAHDVLGGVFFVNGLRPGAERPGAPGEVVYFDPLSLAWTRMGMPHGEWLAWCLSGDLPRYFDGRLWPGWRRSVRNLRADQGIAVFPRPSGDEPGQRGSEVTRLVTPMAEILDSHVDAARLRGRRLETGLGRYPSGRVHRRLPSATER